MSLDLKNKFLISIFLVLLLVCSLSLPVLAHKVILYAYLEGDKIVAEGAFGDGSAIKNAEVLVYGSDNQLLTEVKTDENGIVEFEVPAKSDLKLVLNAGMGHQAEYRIEESELSGVTIGSESSAAAPDSLKISQKNTEIESKNKAGITAVDEKELRTIIAQELAKKIDPINKTLVKMNNSGPGVTEIIGGIGYIFGLMGLYLYFKKRNN